MQFSLTGFSPETGYRVFAFQGVESQVRSQFTVRIDMSLARIYGILIQELPLLCLELLEQRKDGGAEHTLTFTEDDMRAHANTRAMDKEEAQRKKSLRKTPPRRPAPSNTVMGMSQAIPQATHG